MAQSNVLEADLFTGKILLPSAPSPALSSGRKVHEHEPKAAEAFKTISETAEMLALPAHVLRFWESKFGQLKPLKLHGGRRYYRPQDIDTLETIKQLLYKQGYTIKGARKALAETKKHKEPALMAHEKKPRKSAPRLQDTPLFQALAVEIPMPAATATIAPTNGRKTALREIYAELMELKEMIGKLELH